MYQVRLRCQVWGPRGFCDAREVNHKAETLADAVLWATIEKHGFMMRCLGQGSIKVGDVGILLSIYPHVDRQALMAAMHDAEQFLAETLEVIPEPGETRFGEKESIHYQLADWNPDNCAALTTGKKGGGRAPLTKEQRDPANNDVEMPIDLAGRALPARTDSSTPKEV